MSDYWSATEDRTMPAVVYGLYGLGFVTGGLTAIAARSSRMRTSGRRGRCRTEPLPFLIRTFGWAWPG
jgi:uncharacterized membrane protein